MQLYISITDRGLQGCLCDWMQWFTARVTPVIMTGMPQKSAEGEGEQLVHVGHAISMAKTPHLAWASARF